MTIVLYELVGRNEDRPFSPHCWKARMALHHKRLDYETKAIRFTEISEVEGGVSQTLPILRDGDRLVIDSFRIADHLETTYPDRPSLFAGQSGRSYARFLESWARREIHPLITRIAVLEIHEMLDLPDQEYFRKTREDSLGQSLEEFAGERSTIGPDLRASLEPLRSVLKERTFLGGDAPLFADYVVFGSLQWLRIVSTFPLLEQSDPIAEWFGRCLDLFGEAGRNVSSKSE